MIQSDDLLREQAYLVSRGVRALALMGSCEPCEIAGMPHQLRARAGGEPVVPFATPSGTVGYASHAWVVDLVLWADSAPRIQRDRILGLLLGYDSDSIRQFEELGSTLGPFDQLAEVTMDQFGKDNACAKCGLPGAAFEFHAQGYCRSDSKAPEHLHRTCQQCNYDWMEAPLG